MGDSRALVTISPEQRSVGLLPVGTGTQTIKPTMTPATWELSSTGRVPLISRPVGSLAANADSLEARTALQSFPYVESACPQPAEAFESGIRPMFPKVDAIVSNR